MDTFDIKLFDLISTLVQTLAAIAGLYFVAFGFRIEWLDQKIAQLKIDLNSRLPHADSP